MNTQEIVETKTGKDSGSSALTILASLPESKVVSLFTATNNDRRATFEFRGKVKEAVKFIEMWQEHASEYTMFLIN